MTIRSLKEKPNKIEIDLSGPQGNAFYLLGVTKDLCKQMNKLTGEETLNAEEIMSDMKSGNYEHLLDVMEKHFGSLIILWR